MEHRMVCFLKSWDSSFFNDLAALMPLHGQNILTVCAPRLNISGDTWNSLYKYDFKCFSLTVLCISKQLNLSLRWFSCHSLSVFEPAEGINVKHRMKWVKALLAFVSLFTKYSTYVTWRSPYSSCIKHKCSKENYVCLSAQRTFAKWEIPSKRLHLFAVIPTYIQLNLTKNSEKLVLKRMCWCVQ